MHPSTVTEYGAINLEELCLERLSSWLKSGDEVDRLPLPTRLKDKLKCTVKNDEYTQPYYWLI